MYPLLRFIPKNHFSWLVGRLAAVQYRTGFQLALIRWYVKRYGAKLDEAEKPIEAYRSLAAFFQRDLKPNLRPIGPGVVSPVDGTLVQSGPISAGTILQAKGKYYTARELVGDDQAGAYFDNGYFITIYLAPGDYHHIHSPVEGAISGSIHVPGTLWPVNPWSVERIDRLFCVNERITTLLESDLGKVAVVKVGATNVGSITTVYNRFSGNTGIWFRKRRKQQETFSPPKAIKKGDRLGSFRMGSTVVLLFERGELFSNTGGSAPDTGSLKSGPVKLGETLCERTH